MATDWTALGQTAIGAAAAIGGGFLGAWVHGRNQDRAERQQRRERAAEVLAEVAAMLDDVEPYFPPRDDDPNLREQLNKVARRWEQLRMRLFVLGAVHLSAKVRELVESLEGSFIYSLDSVGVVLRRLESGSPSLDKELEKLTESIAATRHDVYDLVRHIQES